MKTAVKRTVSKNRVAREKRCEKRDRLDKLIGSVVKQSFGQFTEILDVIRLGDHSAETEFFIVRYHRVIRVTAGNYRLHGGIEFFQALNSNHSAHSAGNGEVQNHQVERPA